MKTTSQIKKADRSKKNDIYLALSFCEREELLTSLILELPKGSRRMATVQAAIGAMAGVFAETDVTQKLMRGIACLYPKRVSVSFTLGLDEVTIK